MEGNRRAAQAGMAERVAAFWASHPTATGLFVASLFSLFLMLLFYLYYVLTFVAMLLGHLLYWLVYVLDFASHLTFRLAFPGFIVTLFVSVFVSEDPLLRAVNIRQEGKVAIRAMVAVLFGQGLLIVLDYYMPTGVISPAMFLFLLCGAVMVVWQLLHGFLVAIKMNSSPQGSRLNVNDPQRGTGTPHDSRPGTNQPREENVTEDNLCIVCMVNAKTVMVKPCNHLAVCSDCVGRLSECPVCRGAMTSLERVYS